MEEQKKIDKRGVATFKGINITQNKVVTLKFCLRYDEIGTSVGILPLHNTDVTVYAKIPDRKAFNLGFFTVDSINFDRDRNSVVTLKSLVQNVNIEEICEVIDSDMIQLRFLAVLEIEADELTE